MKRTLDATYEDGVFRPSEQPGLPDGAVVRIAILPATDTETDPIHLATSVYEGLDEAQRDAIEAITLERRARVVVVTEESPPPDFTPGRSAQPNGDVLAALIEQWGADARAQAVEKFGSPASWQHELRRERHQPGREAD